MLECLLCALHCLPIPQARDAVAAKKAKAAAARERAEDDYSSLGLGDLPSLGGAGVDGDGLGGGGSVVESVEAGSGGDGGGNGGGDGTDAALEAGAAEAEGPGAAAGAAAGAAEGAAGAVAGERSGLLASGLLASAPSGSALARVLAASAAAHALHRAAESSADLAAEAARGVAGRGGAGGGAGHHPHLHLKGAAQLANVLATRGPKAEVFDGQADQGRATVRWEGDEAVHRALNDLLNEGSEAPP